MVSTSCGNDMDIGEDGKVPFERRIQRKHIFEIGQAVAVRVSVSLFRPKKELLLVVH
jgi:hypothetical protein